MAIRFRKSVKIMPGVKVNFSSSGTSMTVGPKGFTTTYGKRGKYRNVGIPGTGISTRYKVGGKKRHTKNARKGAGRRTTSAGAQRQPQIPAAVREWMEYTGERNPQVAIDLALDGTITLYDANDQVITDPQLISIIKRTPMYKDQLPALKEEHAEEVAARVEEMNAENDEFIKIYQYSPPVLRRDYYEEALARLKPEHVDPNPFTVAPPTSEGVRALLMEDAKREVKGSIFRRGQLRQLYVDDHFPDRFLEETKRWEREKSRFEAAEGKRIAVINERYQEEYEGIRLSLEKALEGATDYIEAAAEEWIAGCDLPVEIFTQFEYRSEDNCLMVDLDLPEIEDLPTQVATQLANGNLKIKDKTQKQLRYEYAECVFGLAVYVAANLMNASPNIKFVTVSGYTQRRNKAGDVCDDYIYSIRFARGAFYDIDYESMDPELFCLSFFENRCNITQTKMFKVIQPFL